MLGFVRALTPVEKWSRDVTVLSEAKLNQFKREGIFDGMSVEVWGTEYIAERRIPTAGVYTKRDKVILRDPYTGSKFTTEWDYVRRSSDPSGALKDFPKMLDEFETELPTSVGLVVEDIESGVAWRHYHDLISTDDKALLFDGYEDALEYLISKNPELAEVTIGPEGILNLLAKAASRLGGKGKLGRRSPGMVLRDKGAYKLILPDPLKPPREGSIGTPREEFRPRGSFDRVNAKVGDQVIDIDIETIAEGFMAGQVNDRDLPYFVSALARRARSRDLAGLEPGIFNHWKLARKSEPASPPTGPLGGPLAEALKKLEEVTKQLSGELGFTVESRVLEAPQLEREHDDGRPLKDKSESILTLLMPGGGQASSRPPTTTTSTSDRFTHVAKRWEDLVRSLVLRVTRLIVSEVGKRLGATGPTANHHPPVEME